jgi:hypothetical protein
MRISRGPHPRARPGAPPERTAGRRLQQAGASKRGLEARFSGLLPRTRTMGEVRRTSVGASASNASRNLFFLEAAPRRSNAPFDPLYFCAVVRACQHNPSWTVRLLSARPQPELPALHRLLSASSAPLPNLRVEPLDYAALFAGERRLKAHAEHHECSVVLHSARCSRPRVHCALYSSGTPLEGVLFTGTAPPLSTARCDGTRHGNSLRADLGNAARLAVLYQHGGEHPPLTLCLDAPSSVCGGPRRCVPRSRCRLDRQSGRASTEWRWIRGGWLADQRSGPPLQAPLASAVAADARIRHQLPPVREMGRQRLVC